MIDVPTGISDTGKLFDPLISGKWGGCGICWTYTRYEWEGKWRRLVVGYH